MARETKAEKAVRLIADQRVRVVSLAARACRAEVRGEHGDYTATFDGRKWGCSCAHGAASGGLCSHALAVQIIFRSVVTALEGEKHE